MSLVDFELSKDYSYIKITGSDFNLNSFEKFKEIIKNLNQKNCIKKVSIEGNFNSRLLVNKIFSKSGKTSLDDLLYLLQALAKTIEDSDILFTANINGIAKGPAMEIALACNVVKAKTGTIFNFTKNEKIFFLGTIQRLINILGYKKTLQLLLIEKTINFKDATDLKIINSNIDKTLIRNKPFWDQAFTNTFIFFNSKIHSTYKNLIPEYMAILSIIFESSICDYEVGLSIERRWVKWLILNNIKKS